MEDYQETLTYLLKWDKQNVIKLDVKLKENLIMPIKKFLIIQKVAKKIGNKQRLLIPFINLKIQNSELKPI